MVFHKRPITTIHTIAYVIVIKLVSQCCRYVNTFMIFTYIMLHSTLKLIFHVKLNNAKTFFCKAGNQLKFQLNIEVKKQCSIEFYYLKCYKRILQSK